MSMNVDSGSSHFADYKERAHRERACYVRSLIPNLPAVVVSGGLRRGLSAIAVTSVLGAAGWALTLGQFTGQ